MKNQSSRAHTLQALNELLVQERLAITHLRMDQLARLQQEKTQLLKALHPQQQAVDEEEQAIIRQITVNNERNRVLLESGLKLVKRMQDNTFRHLALTYAAHGRSLQIGIGPRMLNRSA